ncbi:MAG: GcrA cell cycle regulator [Rhodospirillales bacterium]|nr:GcrA cell cycle regulator [Rhodospirillales bacterium]
MEWNEETIARLRALWAEGLSTAEIGRRMGVSKNAVVGKAHRLALPARPSPIRRDAAGGAPRPPVARRVTGPTLPPLAATLPVEPSPMPPIAAEPPRAEPRRVTEKAPAPRPVARAGGRLVACCWPIGEPGTKSFRFCDAEANPGKPYCTEHAQLAYVKVRDRREEAA